MKKQQHNEKGFTIIEVVLVLAIAALIFLVVFLALPALQRSQRDTQRKQDVGRLLSQLTTFSSNRNGAIPTAQAGLTTFVDNYLKNSNEKFNNPGGDPYTVTYTTPRATATSAVGTILFFPSATCDSAAPETPTVGTSRKVAVITKLESGDDYYCQSN